MRGKVYPVAVDGDGHGITPARAGKSGFIFVPSMSIVDHPRACGEKGKPVRKKAGQTGSPPRVRGKD